MLRAWHPNDWLDEDDWLLALGYGGHSAPFRLTIQLVAADGFRSMEVECADRKGRLMNTHSLYAMGTSKRRMSAIVGKQFASRLAKEVRKWLAHRRRDCSRRVHRGKCSNTYMMNTAWQFLMTLAYSLLQAGSRCCCLPGGIAPMVTQPVLKARIRRSLLRLDNQSRFAAINGF